jgi:hypothetical protein
MWWILYNVQADFLRLRKANSVGVTRMGKPLVFSTNHQQLPARVLVLDFALGDYDIKYIW